MSLDTVMRKIAKQEISSITTCSSGVYDGVGGVTLDSGQFVKVDVLDLTVEAEVSVDWDGGGTNTGTMTIERTYNPGDRVLVAFIDSELARGVVIGTL